MHFSSGYVCGVLCGAGHVEFNAETGKYYISLQTQDNSLAECFSFHMKDVLGVPKVTNKEMSTVVTFYSKEKIAGFVDKWRLKAGSGDWELPPAVLADKDFMFGFLSGFFDSAGSVHVRIKHSNGKVKKRRSIRVYSINEKGLRDVKSVMSGIGIGSMLYKTGGCYCLDIEGWTRLEVFRKTVGFCSQSKKQGLAKALEPIKPVGVKDMHETG